MRSMTTLFALLFSVVLSAGQQQDIRRGVVTGSGGSGSVAWGDITGTLSAQTDLQAALDALLASDTAFASSWNGVTTIPPSKNATYDWGHLFDTDDDGKVNVLDQGVGIAITDSSGILQTPVTTSAGLLAAISDETGSGALVFATAPTFSGLTAGASTFTGPVTLPAADSTNPSLNVGDTDTGLYGRSAGFLTVGINGNPRYEFGSVQLQLNSVFAIGWSSGSIPSGSDVYLYRDGAGTLQGNIDSATAFTFKGPDATGTDNVGGAFIVAGGRSTGTDPAGAVIVQTANTSGTSSSTLNTLSERFHAIPKFVNLTSATATTIFTIPVPATNYVGLTATVTIYATDGTDHQSKTSVITVGAIAKTTTITPTITQVDNTTAASAGTLTCTYTAVDNTSNVLAIKADATSSLTETVLRAKIVVTAINSNGTAALTEQ
jgi:hypothetical protein